MSLALPTGRRGKILALGFAVLAAGAVWAGVVDPVLGWHAERAEALAQRQAAARRMAQIARSLPELEQQAAAAATSGPPPGAVLQGTTDAVAGAALQQLVRDMATGAGAVLSSTETLQAEQAGTFRRIGLRIAFSAPWPVLVRLLLAVEQATPMMLVDDLQVRGPRLQVGPSDPALETSLVVLAFRTGTAPEAATP
jgi:general secretion pathway protein M